MTTEEDEFILEVDDLDVDKSSPVDNKVDVEVQDTEDVKDDVEITEVNGNGKTDSSDDGKFGLQTKKVKVKDPEPCQNFRLDPGADFGMCKCGHPRTAHGPKKANKAQEMLTNLKKKNRASSADIDDGVESSSGPCNKFRLDVSAAEFGTCKCGYKRADHLEKGVNKAEEALKRLKQSNAAETMKNFDTDGPCDNYRVNTAASEFGVCHCGYKKEDHVAKEENIASKLLQNLKEKNQKKNEKADMAAAGILEEEVPEETEKDEVDQLDAAEQNAEQQEETGKKKKGKKGGKGPCVIC